MKILRKIFDFYIDASVHVALAVFAMIRTTEILFGISVDWYYSFFTFLGTIVAYNFMKYGVEAYKYLLVTDFYVKEIQYFSFLAFIGALYFGFFLNPDTWIGIGLLVLLTCSYAIPLLPNTHNLRSLGALKIFVVALVCAGATVMVPLLENGITWNVWIEALQRFLMVLILMIPFEIRDLNYDDPKMRTLPQRYGALKLKVAGGIAAMVFFGLTFLKTGYTMPEVSGKALLLLTFLFLMITTTQRQRPYFASFWVESVPILWFGFMWLSS